MAKGAKDIAFDKERAKFKKEIKILNEKIKDKDTEIETLNSKLKKAESTIRKQSEWIERLLEYTELTPEELAEKLKGEKASEEAAQKFNSIMGVMSKIYGYM